MPIYAFVCDTCHGTREIYAELSEVQKVRRCACGHSLRRDYRAEHPVQMHGDYWARSYQLGVLPEQQADYVRDHPSAKFDSQGRQIFRSVASQERAAGVRK